MKPMPAIELKDSLSKNSIKLTIILKNVLSYLHLIAKAVMLYQEWQVVTEGPSLIGTVPYTLTYRACRVDNRFPKITKPTIYDDKKHGVYVPIDLKDVNRPVNIKGPISPPCVPRYESSIDFLPDLVTPSTRSNVRHINSTQ